MTRWRRGLFAMAAVIVMISATAVTTIISPD
jgi:hypothetical protein